MPKELDERFGKIDRGEREETSPIRRPAFRFSILYQYLPAIFTISASLCIFIIGVGNLGDFLYAAIYERDRIVEFLLSAAKFAGGNFHGGTLRLAGRRGAVARPLARIRNRSRHRAWANRDRNANLSALVGGTTDNETYERQRAPINSTRPGTFAGGTR